MPRSCCAVREATYTPHVSETEFEPGRAIVHRDLQLGRIWYARAEIVVEDREGRLLTYWQPGGAPGIITASGSSGIAPGDSIGGT